MRKTHLSPTSPLPGPPLPPAPPPMKSLGRPPAHHLCHGGCIRFQEQAWRRGSGSCRHPSPSRCTVGAPLR